MSTHDICIDHDRCGALRAQAQACSVHMLRSKRHTHMRLRALLGRVATFSGCGRCADCPHMHGNTCMATCTVVHFRLAAQSCMITVVRAKHLAFVAWLHLLGDRVHVSRGVMWGKAYHDVATRHAWTFTW